MSDWLQFLSAAISIPLSAIALWKTVTSGKAITKTKADAAQAKDRLDDRNPKEAADQRAERIERFNPDETARRHGVP